nr:reverse transcriptase domain-containing protein [Tanacetum cinerariifolium]
RRKHKSHAIVRVEKLSLPELTPTLMTPELADRSISRPIGVVEDVYVKVGKFHFPADFVVVDFDADPRVLLILERSFLKTGRVLIDVFEVELTLCVGREAITFNLDQTSRYLANYNDMTANRIDVIDMACEEYSHEVLGFSDVIASGNPTPYYDPIIFTSSLTLAPYGDSDFFLEEVDAFLTLEYDSSIDEPPEVALKDLPHHLEYVILEGDDKLPIIIAKDLSVEEKVALIKVLKSHKQAIAWKLSDIKATVGQTQNVYAAGAYQGGNHHPHGNNQGRNQFFQRASHGPNPPPTYQAPAYQAPGYQAPVHQPSIPQPQVMTTAEFTNYMKANDAILKNMQTNMTSLTNSNLELKSMFGQFMKMNTALSSGSGTLPSNTVTNPKEDLNGITTQSGNAYQGPTIPTTSFSLPKVLECETEVTKDIVPPTNNGSTKDVRPLVVQVEKPMPNSEPVVAPVIELVAAPVSALKPNQKPSIPYPSRFHDQKLRDKTNDQKEKKFKIFQDLNFNISFVDALILMPKFGLSIKSLLTNKDKLFELVRTPLNEHCSTVLLKKLPEK